MSRIALRAASIAALVLALGVPALLPRSLHAQEGGDLQAQILYAFHTEDVHRLGNLVQTLGTQVKAVGADGALRYHLAHAEYRLGLLDQQTRAHGAGGAFSDCIDQLKPILEQDVKSVEALALQGACYEELAGERHLEAVLLRSRAAERRSAAYQLAPRNPRVLYLKSRAELQHSRPGSAEHNQAFKELELAAQLFDESSATRPDVPGWGHAEAYLALGMQLAARGDQLGARNWIEKSLIVAPDYKAAQRQLQRLVGR
jgi:tetratricopeptide (TPR) repeat protein